MLARNPVDTEVVNDLNDRVVNWWRVVRDMPEEFGRLTENTPISRAEFIWAVEAVDDPALPDIRRALAFHILVTQSMNKGDGYMSAGRWNRTLRPDNRRTQYDAGDFHPLADRMRRVQLDNCCALDLLARTAERTDTVIYADPPYPNAYTHAYTFGELDYGRLGELLQAQKGAVAVSGYPGDWDSLGWEVSMMERTVIAASTHQSKRVLECLYRNARCVELATVHQLL